MMPCQFYGNSPEGLPVSSFDTRLYYTDDKGVNNYQVPHMRPGGNKIKQ
jgi:hypothetical protein